VNFAWPTLCLAACWLAACSTDRESMAIAGSAAAQYLACPQEGLRLEPVGGAAFRVEGCGKTAFYRCTSSDQPRRRCCRPVPSEQEATSLSALDEESPDRVCREAPGQPDRRRESLTAPTP
jgi:hypothetical protein